MLRKRTREKERKRERKTKQHKATQQNTTQDLRQHFPKKRLHSGGTQTNASRILGVHVCDGTLGQFSCFSIGYSLWVYTCIDVTLYMYIHVHVHCYIWWCTKLIWIAKTTQITQHPTPLWSLHGGRETLTCMCVDVHMYSQSHSDWLWECRRSHWNLPPLPQGQIAVESHMFIT